MSVRWADLGTRTPSAAVFGAVVLFVTWWNEISFDAMLLLAAVILLREWIGLTRTRHGIWVAIGVLYLFATLLALAFLRHDGFRIVYLLFALVWASDIGAYFVGKKWGKHKIAPSISPGKSWEGLAGAVLLTSAVAALVHFFQWPGSALLAPTMLMLHGIFYLHGLSHHAALLLAWILNSLLFGGAVALLGLAGDLFESSLKRRAGVKDSGTLLPGHGGLFDRVDALLPNALFFALVLLWIQSIKTWP